jgi:nicotinate-nucleotide pyrophosphorylase (carboxylating)
MIFDIHHPEIADAVARAFLEDIGTGDVTTEACIPEGLRAEGFFTARQNMVVAGVELLTLMFDKVTLHKRSGESAGHGDVLATVRARARKLLTRERVALNFLQRLSGVATLARAYVDEVAGTECQILDTRKTTPGLRRLEKMAAAAGGVLNHRMGLYDAILVKNNHITLAGGVRAAVESAKAMAEKEDLPIEVEVRTRLEIEEALALGVPRLLLDNMTPSQAAEEIRFIARRASVELSGGITLTRIREYAETGANFISAGAITHSATAVDINLRIASIP